MIEVTTTGFRFCSNPNTVYGCDYEVEPPNAECSGAKRPAGTPG